MADISAEKINEIAIVSISGEISMSTVSYIDDACREYLVPETKVFALDMRGVTFIDSFGISRILKISKAYSANDSKFLLINMNDNIRQIFKIATFDKFFTIMTKSEFDNKYFQ